MGKFIKNFLKYTVYLIIIIIYATVFWRIFIGCDASVTEKILLDDETKQYFEDDRENFDVIKINPTTTMDSKGKLQIKYITHVKYEDKVNDLQFTAKYKLEYFEKKFESELPENPFRYEIVKSSGQDGTEETIYDDYVIETENRYDYGYIRVCMKDVPLSIYNSQEGFPLLGDNIKLRIYENVTGNDEPELLLSITLCSKGDGLSQPNKIFLDIN